MRRTRLNLDDTLASMGTIYSQVQLLNAMDIDSGRATHIAEEIDAEVMRLNDVLSALSEAYQGAERRRRGRRTGGGGGRGAGGGYCREEGTAVERQ